MAEHGWLYKEHFYDFGGSGAVHMLGGAASLVAAVVIGPRIGRFSRDSEGNVVDNHIPGHSSALSVLGAFILWFGWYGFNPVSTMEYTRMQAATRVAVATTLSACSGGTTALILSVWYDRHPSVTPIINGILSGLVGITASSSVVEPYAAVAIGAVSALICGFASKALIRFRIDDPLDASPVHFFCGLWGVIAVGLFASKEHAAEEMPFSSELSAKTHAGLFFGGDGSQLKAQMIGALAISSWSFGTCCILFLGLRSLKILRVPVEDEIKGLDITHHGGHAYNMEPMHGGPTKQEDTSTCPDDGTPLRSGQLSDYIETSYRRNFHGGAVPEVV
eukprot:CAMPEP_0177578096 /NCGR_PEP_ID=MMETSP0419_2-20121207/148_1 /TAXON_ID=582737 /ORGANISM="Tetraselmis sp., Strain GSL018" /LENGTH=332 /DNA_ID=CAMNT_0019066481 /DNA_START=630 /DNA_END=1628 /DNA_ORIENTATION=-